MVTTEKVLSFIIDINAPKRIQLQFSYNSFIHSDYFYSASSSPLLLRGALDTAPGLLTLL